MDKKFPREFSDNELKDKINSYGDFPIGHMGNEALRSVAYYTKAMLGAVELQGRQNGRMAIGSLIIAILALIVSIGSLVISLMN
jgi:hypothetical protein